MSDHTDEIRTDETTKTKTTPSLPDLYDTLEKHVGINETYKLDLKDALLAVEKDDEAMFRAKAAFILEGWKKEKKKKRWWTRRDFDSLRGLRNDEYTYGIYV